jgi:hypothetical protein
LRHGTRLAEWQGMRDSLSFDRREFTLRSAMAILGGVTITISSGCGGGGGGGSTSGGSPTGSSPVNPDTLGSISSNHGHKASITSAQLATGSALLLNIQGDADHAHMVELTAAELIRIKSQEVVSKECTSEGAHTHMVTFSRSSEPTGPGY